MTDTATPPPEPTPERVAAFCCSLCHGPWEDHVDQAAAALVAFTGSDAVTPTRAEAEAAVTTAHCRRPPWALVD